jgi:hypothetical protein
MTTKDIDLKIDPLAKTAKSAVAQASDRTIAAVHKGGAVVAEVTSAVNQMARGTSERVEEAVERAKHGAHELTDKAAHAAREVTQKAGRAIEETATKAVSRGHALVNKAGDKIKGR